MDDYIPIQHNEYKLDFITKENLFSEKWTEFFTDFNFTFYIPPIVGDSINIFSFCNEREDREFMEDFFKVFSTEYVKVIGRIHHNHKCILQIEPVLIINN